MIRNNSKALGKPEAVLWAEAKLGELLKRIEIKPISDGSGKGTFGGREKTLPEGITKKQSHEAQALADNPEETLF